MEVSSSENPQFKMAVINIFNKNDLGKLLIPNKIYKVEYKKNLEKLFNILKFDNIHYYIITNLFILSIILSTVVFVMTFRHFSFYIFSYSILLKVGILALIWFIINIVIYYMILIFYLTLYDSRHKKIEHDIETDLPEFIDNLVSNLKGGNAIEKALLKSVRPEQKSLLKEITLINEKVMTGRSVTQCLIEFRKRFDSPILTRTFLLIEEGLAGGGNLAEPLERISQNLKKIYELDAELKANAGGFSVVITVISVGVAPLLFALALTLLNFIRDLFGLIASTGNEFMNFGEIPDEFSDFLIIFAYAMISIITLFSSLITAQLKNEKAYTVIKYIPIYIVISIIIFRVMSSILLGFFGSILG